MNVVLWILQVLLAVQAFAGGLYKLVSFDEIATMPVMTTLPRGAWGALGVLEMACGVLLVVPAATKWKPQLTPIAAAVLALESLALAALYASYTLALDATNPLPYVLVGAAMAAFVSYGRYSLRPVRSRAGIN